MDPLARRIINGLQSGFPICARPFAMAAASLGLEETQLIEGLEGLLREGYLTRFGPFFNVERMGGGFTLAAMRVPEDAFEAVIGLLNAQPEIAHNYAREHALNMWFVVATEYREEIAGVLARIESLTGLAVFNLPKLEEYRLGFGLHLDENGGIDTFCLPLSPLDEEDGSLPDPMDRALIAATQAGLPLTPEPYHVVADRIGMAIDLLLARLRAMLRLGWIRRIGAATNHYKLGLTGNGMSVWDVPDEQISRLGRQIGALDFVTHCYRRPRHLPEWPYNLFVMVHGPDRGAVEEKIQRLSQILGPHNRGHTVLHSTRILKKTGLRLKGMGGTES